MTDLAIHTQGLGKRFGERAALEHIDLEEPRFHRHLTGRENLHVHAAARDRSAHGRVDAALQRVGLGRRADDKVGTYSLGMRQRLGVARCLVCDPELLILDEPVNGLDPAGILEFRNLIRELVAEGRTVLLSSHLLDEVEKTCGRSGRRRGDPVQHGLRAAGPGSLYYAARAGSWRTAVGGTAAVVAAVALQALIWGDDQPLMRTGFKTLLEATGTIEVVGEAGDGEEAVRVADALEPTSC